MVPNDVRENFAYRNFVREIKRKRHVKKLCLTVSKKNDEIQAPHP